MAGGVCGNLCGAIEKRSDSAEFLSSAPDRLKGASTRWRNTLPGGIPPSSLIRAIIHFVATRIGYPNPYIAPGLARGMPLVGHAPDSDVFRVTTCAWELGGRRRNLEMRSRDYDRERRRRRRRRSSVGPRNPYQRPIICPSVSPVSPRFLRWEEHGERGPEIRATDEFKASRVNDLPSARGSCVPENSDVSRAATLIRPPQLGNERRRSLRWPTLHAPINTSAYLRIDGKLRRP